MAALPKENNVGTKIVKWIIRLAILACFYFLLFETPLQHYILPPLWNWLISITETFFYVIWYVFVFCSVAMVALVWMGWDNSRFRSEFKRFSSILMAPDYYKGSKRYDFYKAIRTAVTKHHGLGPEELKVDGELGKKDVVITGGSIERQKEEDRLESKEILQELDGIRDKSDGIHRTYHENGKVAKEVCFKSGKLQGAFRTFYDDGKLRQEKFYKEGKLDGSFKAYDEYGMMYFEITYQEGVQHGIENSYYKNGVVQYKDTYVNGELVNRKTYSESGDLKSDHDYQGGHRA